MYGKILVADDSSTIQKVIQITLAKNSYKLIECFNEADLMAKIQSDKFNLILLDFNLSENKSGYELSEEITRLAPQTPIMAMLGTFDSVDEKALAKAGIKDQVIKPFESTKFIEKCTSLIEQGLNEPVLSPFEETTNKNKEEGYDNEEIIPEIAEGWEMDAPSPPISKEARETREKRKEGGEGEEEKNEEVKVGLVEQRSNSLSKDVQGWGMSVPEVMSDQSGQDDEEMPPPIELLSDDDNDDVTDSAPTPPTPETHPPTEIGILPSREELDFPNFPIVESDGPISLENKDIGDVTGEFAIPLRRSSDVKDVKKELNEDEEVSSDEFWAPEKEEQRLKLDANINEEVIVEKIKESLTPVIEALVKKYCKNKVEQIAWDVIPDLAENLIREELKELSESVLQTPSQED